MKHIVRFRPSAVTLLLLFAVMVSGCVEFQRPLSDAQTSEVDEELLGTWYPVEDATAGLEEEPWLLKISRQNGSKALRLESGLPSQGKKKSDLAGLPPEIFTTKANGRRFFSALAAPPEKKPGAQDQPTTYDVFAYRIQGESLVILILDVNAIGDAIQAGKLQGSTTPQRGLFLTSRYKSALVTDAPQKALDFLGANFEKCFAGDPALRFTRTAPAPRRPKANR